MRQILFVFSTFVFLFSSNVQGQRNYPPEIEGAKEFVYKKASDVDLKIWAFTPEGWTSTDSRPGIVFFFGGGWKGGSPTQFVTQSKHLAGRGMVATVADYRVRGRSGTLAKDCVADARDAMRYVRSNAEKLGIDPKRLAAGGGSAGGHIAACLGVIEADPESKPNAMALFNPACVIAPIDGKDPWPADRYAEMEERMGVKPEALSPIHHVSSKAPPCVIFHGTADDKVLFHTAKQFSDKMIAAGAKSVLHAYEGEGHGFFNLGLKAKKSADSAYAKTLEQLDAFLVELGWLKNSSE
jgi:acetyl esterase/lipase